MRLKSIAADRMTRFEREHWPWRVGAIAVAALALLPLAAVVTLALSASGGAWPHLLATVLPDATMQTLLLMAGVAALTLTTGAGAAWLVTMYRFPGRRAFDWLLVLPLAMPTYITAYCYGEFLDYTGPLQSGLRAVFGFQDARAYWFPEWRSTGGAIFILSAVLYPYVYLTARASFLQQSVCVLEVARTLGRTGWGVFFSVALPLARPALASGVALALMETINDIGAVEYLGVKTLSAMVYATWLQRSDLGGAAQIALVVIAFVLLLVGLERASRMNRRFHHTSLRYRVLERQPLTGWRGWAAACGCALPVLCGFLIPAFVLIEAVFTTPQETAGSAFWRTGINSMGLAGAAATCTVILAWGLSFAARIAPSRPVKGAARIAGLGYAMPGAVIALGVLIPFAAIDNGVDAFMRREFGVSTGLLLSGSVFALLFAYCVRFLAVALGAVDAGYQQLSPNIDAAARTLGANVRRILREIHAPLLRPAIGAAALLVFVDAMKELPATLLLRPFNFETLATQIYIFASLEQFERSAGAAMMIVGLGLVPVLMLHRAIASGRPGSAAAPLSQN
ncbi:MAG: iron ABC transporter permease [Hyphomicrobiales bacterium]|nr:iron ABC transporter permease [Hyphomicrobiales bacterium]